MQQYEALMAVHSRLKQQLGLRHVAPPEDSVDISTGALEYLAMENGKLADEKARRLMRVEESLDRLRAVCRELGEDAAEAAEAVHPGLRGLSADKESAEVLGAVYRLAGAGASSPGGGAGGEGAGALLGLAGDLELSDATFERLGAKIGEMDRLKAEREAQCRDVLEMLAALWSALAIPEDAPERAMVHKLLAADRPQRLHRRTLDKCMAEVTRLEGCKAQAMRDLAMSKARELEQLCISTRISPPHTGPLLAELDKPGQMTAVLTKLVRLVAEVGAMAAKRGPILAQVAELQAAAADSAWLRAYSGDADRYKGRDASRNMQRAIKAGKLRERLAPMLEGLLGALAEWEIEEGGPFLYDELVLQDTVLRSVEVELEQVAAEKAPRPKASAASGASGPSGSSSRPPMSRPSTSSGAPPRGAANNGSATARGPAGERPMLTPRHLGDTGRRLSMHAAPPPLSSRSSIGGAGGPKPTPSASASASGRMSASDFLRATEALGGSMPPPAHTPPVRRSMGAGFSSGGGMAPSPAASRGGAPPSAQAQAPPSAQALTPSLAAAEAGSDVKNSAQDLFRRYLGDPADGATKPTPAKTPGAKNAATPQPGGRLSFSAALAPGAACADDDGGDDVARAKCDTPKSTATSRAAALAARDKDASQAKSPVASSLAPATSLVSPSAKQSRIPKLRL
ncbi:hypothetical protein HYH03_010557 [Edaphochlamys debaryana]|uniref:Uncharacterized protein n=1 Tax=Edaphochlamys debaryana TaxID=47281 RepID=A0A836BXD6_9CHLO|nr:hypothetical protein HYH03_010557 [Edaphochlamys debaryana]|eukprot:KAG2491113.1 hypothetical protein HYH03_010557 [Edaphochlamys debaryana]